MERPLDRLTVTLPEGLKREARAKAIREGTNLSELARVWLQEYVKGEWPPRPPTKEPDK